MYKTQRPLSRAARLAWPTALAALFTASSATAQDRFEIQVYDTEVAGAGEIGFEFQRVTLTRSRRT